MATVFSGSEEGFKVYVTLLNGRGSTVSDFKVTDTTVVVVGGDSVTISLWAVEVAASVVDVGVATVVIDAPDTPDATTVSTVRAGLDVVFPPAEVSTKP